MIERFREMGWNCRRTKGERGYTGMETIWDTDEIIGVANALVEEELLNAQGSCLQSIVYGPERGAGSVADSGSAMTGHTVRLAAGRYSL